MYTLYIYIYYRNTFKVFAPKIARNMLEGSSGVAYGIELIHT